MIDTSASHDKFLNLTGEYFSRVGQQEEDPDLFSTVRRSVISYVETAPLKSCDQGWVYDHSLVSSTITSQVSSENIWHYYAYSTEILLPFTLII